MKLLDKEFILFDNIKAVKMIFLVLAVLIAYA